MEVMVWHFVGGMHKVMTTLIVVLSAFDVLLGSFSL
jgi:hypothetical protein